MKNYILDFDGTLVHLQADWTLIRGVIRQAIEKIGGNYEASKSLDTNLFKLRGRPEFFDVMQEVSSLERSRLVESPINIALVTHLLDQKAQYAIFTSNSRQTAQAAFNKGPLAALKPLMIVGKEDVDFPKPHPCGAQMILKRTGWKKDNVIYIGDSRSDEDSATGAGIEFKLVNGF